MDKCQVTFSKQVDNTLKIRTFWRVIANLAYNVEIELVNFVLQTLADTFHGVQVPVVFHFIFFN